MCYDHEVKLFIDTEFSDFLDPHLISLGAVTEDLMNEYYVEISDYDRRLSSSFVREVVEPLLDLPKHGKTYMQASLEFGLWLGELAQGLPGDEKLYVTVDYATDWELMLDLLQTDLSLLPKVNKAFTLINNDLLHRVVIRCSQLAVPNMNQKCEGAAEAFGQGLMSYFVENKLPIHHALNDAKANAHGWRNAMTWIEKNVHPI